MNIEDYIPYGKENAISRAELRMLTGIDDRAIRLLIKEANKNALDNGYAILSSSSAKGYWKSTKRIEIDKYLKESDRRQKTESENNEGIRLLRERLVEKDELFA